GTDPPVPVAINNLNGGNPFGTNAQHADLFINNEGGSIATQADGLTKVLTLQATITHGLTYHMKIAISDTGDSAFDSWVLIKAHSLSVVCPLIP
ncbi:MAG: choice-of-anchor L domain-containing protein, partial [Acidobacteriia bacterium]|nr:choice-of-anchor L domain-containing protein [Terriglobia bacterium]